MSTDDACILVAYHTDEGQTARVAERIADRLRTHGAEVDVADTRSAPDLVSYDVVVLGDSIHLGHHSRQLRQYAKEHADELNARPTALFQVSLTSAIHDDEHDAQAGRYAADLIEEAGIDPHVVGFFAGALAYTRYGWIKRRIMRRIAEVDGQSTDTSEDHELTDWEAVDAFADDVFGLVLT